MATTLVYLVFFLFIYFLFIFVLLGVLLVKYKMGTIHQIVQNVCMTPIVLGSISASMGVLVWPARPLGLQPDLPLVCVLHFLMGSDARLSQTPLMSCLVAKILLSLLFLL